MEQQAGKKATSINKLAAKYIEERTNRSMYELVERLKPGLTLHANKFVKDIDAANDIVADALIKIWRKIDTYNPKWCFSTWCYKIVYNESMQHLRKKKQKNTYSIEGHIKYMGSYEDVPDLLLADNGISELSEDPIWDFEAQEDIEEVLASKVLDEIQKLPEHYQQIIYDREVNKMKYNEISEKYGLQINTVKTRIIRARQKICDVVDGFDGQNRRRKKSRKKNNSGTNEQHKAEQTN